MSNTNVEITICKNCKEPVSGQYCSLCGQSIDIGPITFKNTLIHGLEYFDVNAPLRRTIRGLFSKPEMVINAYLDGERKNYTSPLRVFLLTTAIYILVANVIDFNAVEAFSKALGAREMPDPNTLSTKASDFFRKHINSMLFLYALVFGIVSKVFFWGSKYSVSENFSAGLYILSGYILMATFIIVGASVSPYIFILNYIVVLIYPLLVSYRLHSGNPYFKAFRCLLLSLITYISYAILGFFTSIGIVILFR